MTNSSSLVTPNIPHLLTTPLYRHYDALIGSFLSLCLIVGLPGNLISLLYFTSSPKRDFSTLLYILVSGVDICTSVTHLPVTIALFNNRNPGLFEGSVFCVSWFVFFSYLQMMSMFLVMLLSVSRTVTLYYLRYIIKIKHLLIAFLSYTVFIILWRVLLQ